MEYARIKLCHVNEIVRSNKIAHFVHKQQQQQLLASFKRNPRMSLMSSALRSLSWHKQLDFVRCAFSPCWLWTFFDDTTLICIWISMKTSRYRPIIACISNLIHDTSNKLDSTEIAEVLYAFRSQFPNEMLIFELLMKYFVKRKLIFGLTQEHCE